MHQMYILLISRIIIQKRNIQGSQLISTFNTLQQPKATQNRNKMLIKFIIRQQLILPAELYTQNPSKSIRNHVFIHYLFKIINLGSQSSGICIKIEGIEILDNIILRKTADLKVKIKIALVILRLLPDEYYEGEVGQSTSQGIIIKFMGNLLQGFIPMINLHQDTIYNQQANSWILTPEQGKKGYEWKSGASVGFKIKSTKFYQPNLEEKDHTILSMADLIQIKANEAGLGPKQWWI